MEEELQWSVEHAPSLALPFTSRYERLSRLEPERQPNTHPKVKPQVSCVEETAALIYTCYPNAALSIVPWLLKSIPRHEIRLWTLEKVWPTLIRLTRYKSEVDLMDPTSANQRIKSPRVTSTPKPHIPFMAV